MTQIDWPALILKADESSDPERALATLANMASDAADAVFSSAVRVTPDVLDGGFVVEHVGMPGLMAQGDTEGEALANLVSAYDQMYEAKVAENEHLRAEIERLRGKQRGRHPFPFEGGC